MTLKQVFTVNYMYAFLFGAGFIMLPTFCSELVGFQVAGDAPLIGRVLGIFVLATGLLTFFARNSTESDARDAIVLTLFTLYCMLILYKVALHTLFGIPPNAVLGMIYVLHVGFVGAYGYFLVKGRRRARPISGPPGP